MFSRKCNMALSGYLPAFESLARANFIVRMKQEQSTIPGILIRIHTARETSFVSSGYAIAEAAMAFLIIVIIPPIPSTSTNLFSSWL